MTWIVFAGYLAAFLFLLRKIAARFDVRYRWLVVVFLLKAGCGLAYGYFDLHTGYGGDSLNYFNDGCWIHETLREHPDQYIRMLTGIGDTTQFIKERYAFYLYTWKENDFDYFFNDSRTIVRLHAFLRIFSFGSYGVHVLFFSFLAMTGLLLLYRTFRPFLPGKEELLFLVLFLAPSSLVWFSALLKEPLVILGSGLLFSAAVRLIKEGFSRRQFLLLLSAAVLLLATRFYILLCWLPALFVMAWLHHSPSYAWLKIVTVLAGLVAWAASFDYFATEYRFSQVLHDQLMNNVKSKEYFSPGTKVEYDDYTPDFVSVLAQSPKAFLDTAIAPVSSLGNPFRLLFFLENLGLILFAGWILSKARKPVPDAMPLLVGALFFLVLLYVLIGLTTPFEGTMIRIRSLALPFLLAGMLLLVPGETPGPVRRLAQFFHL